MLDMPCGDFSWMQDLIKKNNYINYTGYDIVEDIISYNNKKYSKNNVSFFCKDIINEKNFNNFDLVFIRDFFIHIDNANIDILLKNIKSSKVRFLACSNNNNEFNKDVVVGQHRNVNLTIKPFYMKEIFHTFSEGVDGCSINIYKIS
jgi:2-polyprenyl-3-methyl-5-hydroxy-6-metoxy-1,4-benzoquinol methylase